MENEKVLGSSPHTRGAPPLPRRRSHAHGIIPAYAGSTRTSRTRTSVSRDHPRIRGEHSMMSLGLTSLRGSSPHTRGARRYAPIRRRMCGIIPAYAGSTWRPPRHATTAGDHPRIRGEHSLQTRAHSCTPGSSPHTRGAREVAPRGLLLGGIIPAYAGSTASHMTDSSEHRDHPRIRGEHLQR